MKMLVTGGAGFVGSHLVEKLVEDGYDVIVVDDFSNGSMDNLSKVMSKIKIVRHDISRPMPQINSKMEAIFHLACHPRSFSLANPFRDVEVNAIGMLRMLEFARKQHCKIIYTSNSGIYGEPKYLPIDEAHPDNPTTPYDANKLVAEYFCKIYSRIYGVPTVILRLATVYGPRQRVNPELGWRPVVAEFISRIISGESPTIFGDGQQTRDFIYVEDVANCLIESYKSKSSEGEVFNCSTQIETSINQLLKIICDVQGSIFEPKYGSPSIWDVRRMCYSYLKAREYLKWTPSTSLKEGIIKTFEWHKQHQNFKRS